MINKRMLKTLEEAGDSFSAVIDTVESEGAAVILQNDKPMYAVIDYSEYENFKACRNYAIDKMSDEIIEENSEAFLELAK